GVAARCRSPHPHWRRAAAVRFPDVGVRLRRAVVHRADVARLRRAAAGGRNPRVPFTRPPVRRLAHAGGRLTGLPVVSARTRLGLEILAFGAAGGVIGDALLRAMPWGLNVARGTAGPDGPRAGLVRRRRLAPGPETAGRPVKAAVPGGAFGRREPRERPPFDSLGPARGL